jgi:hypothetical protein
MLRQGIRDNTLLDQQRDVVISFGLDVFCLYEAIRRTTSFPEILGKQRK